MLFSETPRNPDSLYLRPYPGTKDMFCIRDTTLNLLPELEVSQPPNILAYYFKFSCPALTLRASDWQVTALPRHTFKARVLRLLQQFLAKFSAVLSFEA